MARQPSRDGAGSSSLAIQHPRRRARRLVVRRMKTFNLNTDEWDGTRDRDGWRIRAAFVGQRIGGELIGATMSEVEPGNRLWPYHTHYLNEEWVIVLAANRRSAQPKAS